ncbi:Crp/Fnr family transcriptional regulator [Saccharothrix sp. HUAS TT1]|uniref:Crp/Fnr family transcriptional regulator n=1 Tax=unclassified Saccharothrix TaxID=2593673 RepID=UPI00345BF410
MTPRPPRGFQALLGEAKWQALLDRGSTRVHPPGALLLRQGDPGATVLALVSGRVKVLGTEPDGGQLLITLRGPGALLGEIAVRSASPRTATVRAIDRCTTRVLTASAFDAFLDDHRAHGELADYVVSKLSQAVPYQVQLVHFAPERRIARLLLEIVSLADDGSPHVPFSQREVADALGLARSTVALHLQRLKETGALKPGPRLVVADLGTLKQHAGV